MFAPTESSATPTLPALRAGVAGTCPARSQSSSSRLPDESLAPSRAGSVATSARPGGWWAFCQASTIAGQA